MMDVPQPLGNTRSGSLGARLVRTLADRRISHCYWKTSLHLERALVDPTKDLDLLAAADDWDRVVTTLRELGYRRMALPHAAASLPGIEHWLGFDESYGRLDHVHLHAKIYTGRPPFYEWRLPWEGYLLAHTQRHPFLEAIVLEPSLELVLLAVRAVLEPRLHEGGRFSEAARRDVEEIQARADAGRVRLHANALLGEAAAMMLASTALTSPGVFAGLTRAVKLALEPSRRLPGRRAHASWAAHAAASVMRGVGRRLRVYERPCPGLRRPGQGLIVAVLGVDGAGKTTQTQQLRVFLADCVAVEQAYLGRGDWVSVAQQVAAEIKWGILETFTSRRRPLPAGPVDHFAVLPVASGRAKDRAVQMVRDAARVAMARRKRRDLARVARLRRAGVVVLTDRFPHPDLMELDGPGILVQSQDPSWRRALGALERAQFGRMRCSPDLIIRLRLDPRIAHGRKPDHRLQDIERKASALDSGTFPGATVVDVDAARPVEVVAAELRRIVWDAL